MSANSKQVKEGNDHCSEKATHISDSLVEISRGEKVSIGQAM